MRKSSSVVRLALAAGLCAASFTLIGCTNGADARHAEFLSNPTPSLDTFAENSADISNRHAKVYDTNFRRINHEMSKVFFLDRPMRGGYPIPY